MKQQPMYGMLDLDEEKLKQLMAGLELSDQDRSAARSQGLLAAGLGILANQGRGNPWATIGQGGLLGVQAYQGGLEDARKQNTAKFDRELQLAQLGGALRDQRMQREAQGFDYSPQMPPQTVTAPGPNQDGSAGVTAAYTPEPGIADQLRRLSQLALNAPNPYVQKGAQERMKALEQFKPEFKEVGGALYQVSPTGGQPQQVVAPRQKMEFVNGMAVDPYNMAPGTYIHDPNKVMSMGPDGRPMLNETLARFELQKAATGAPRVNVDARQQAEKAFAVAQANSHAKRLEEMYGGALSSGNAIKNIDAMMDAAQRGMIQGWGSTKRVDIVNFLGTLGVPMDMKKMGNAQEYSKHAADLLIQQAGGSLGTGFSSTDRDFMKETIAQLETDPSARGRLLNFMRNKHSRNITAYESANAYANDPANGGRGLIGWQDPRISAREQQSAGSVPRINSQAEFIKLPSGTEFIAPDGSRRRKP